MADKRPEFVTDEHLNYLDELRESGKTNMYGAWRYLEAEFPDVYLGTEKSFHSSDKSGACLVYWMRTFGNKER